MKILCLHGAYGSASNFQIQLSPFIDALKKEEPVQFKWINGDNTATPPKGFENYFGKPPLYRHFRYDGMSELDDILTKLRDLQQGEAAEDTMRKLIGNHESFHGPAVLETIESLLKIVDEDPEIDGILGYSEGAMAAATLVLEERRRWEQSGRERRIKFAIFFAGWPPLRLDDDGTAHTLLADQTFTKLVWYLHETDTKTDLSLNRASLQRQTRIILDGIEEVLVQSRESEELLTTTVAIPTPDFPAQTSDHILNALLRTKFDPSIEEWVEEGEHYDPTRADSTHVLAEVDLSRLWAGAAEIYHTHGSRYPWGADYSREEMDNGIENVVTGLKRDLVEPILEPDEFDDDDAGEDQQEGVQEQMEREKPIIAPTPSAQTQQPGPVGPVLKFLSTGSIGREY
ncbi:hypothetical protein DV735_g3243, partial [Chaetothyriales sp. CBS 134920]